ncbi:hypothetical protein AL520_25645 [Achromobacter xylosoxidans]|nr:hypothetical protein AL520_25645 [Achromobacter xylosoxidans]
MKSKSKHSSSGGGAEWAKFLSLAFVACPVVAFLMICIYGFVVWFGQILFWGAAGMNAPFKKTAA